MSGLYCLVSHYSNLYSRCLSLCIQAIKQGLGEYEYVWVLQGWYSEGWWKDTSDVQCNSTILASFLESQRAVTVGYYLPSLEDTPAVLTGTVSIQWSSLSIMKP